MSEHVMVFADPDTFAGWPANHGAWSWGDEFLVGYLRGPWNPRGAMHKIKEPMVKRQARSLDGGLTWREEDPGVDFEARASEVERPVPFKLGGDTIIRVCGNYDHGGEACRPEGGFYLSRTRGRSWTGVYVFEGPEVETIFSEPFWNTSRTCVLGDLVFLSAAHRLAWGSDVIACFRHGHDFRYQGGIPIDDARSVMPAVARVSSRIVLVARRRRVASWIETYASDDNGVTWRSLGNVATVGGDNGNPPALIAVGGILFCAWGDRLACAIMAARSEDGGATWSAPVALRRGRESDIGYPVLFRRTDGDLVCVYYWSDEGEPQRIEATHFTLEDVR